MALPSLKPTSVQARIYDVSTGARSEVFPTLTQVGDTLVRNDSVFDILVTYDDATKIWTMDVECKSTSASGVYEITWPIELSNIPVGVSGTDDVYLIPKRFGFMHKANSISNFAWVQSFYGHPTESQVIFKGDIVSALAGDVELESAVTIIDDIVPGATIYTIEAVQGAVRERHVIGGVSGNFLDITDTWANTFTGGTYEIREYPSGWNLTMFAPFIMQADEEDARFIGVAEWPPGEHKFWWANQQMALNRNIHLKPGQSATIKIMYFNESEIGTDTSAREPWQKAYNIYRPWFESNLVTPVYSNALIRSHGQITKQLQNYSRPFDINLLKNDFEGAKPVFNWLQLWGQMSSTVCCEQTKTVHPDYNPEIEAYVDEITTDGYLGGYYSRTTTSIMPRGSDPIDESYLVDGVSTSLEWWTDWINQHASWGANISYLDVLLTPHGKIENVANLLLDFPHQCYMEGANIAYPVGYACYGDVVGADTVIGSGSNANITSGGDTVTLSSGTFSGSIQVGDSISVENSAVVAYRRFITEIISTTQVRVSPNWNVSFTNRSYTVQRFEFTPNVDSDVAVFSGKNEVTFPELGCFVADNRPRILGGLNNDAYATGYFQKNEAERLAFILGCKMSVDRPSGQNTLLSDDQLDPLYIAFAVARDSVNWHTLDLRYEHKWGISNVPIGMRIRRFEDQATGRSYFTIDNPEQLEGQVFTYDGEDIPISSALLSIKPVPDLPVVDPYFDPYFDPYASDPYNPYVDNPYVDNPYVDNPYVDNPYNPGTDPYVDPGTDPYNPGTDPYVDNPEPDPEPEQDVIFRFSFYADYYAYIAKAGLDSSKSLFKSIITLKNIDIRTFDVFNDAQAARDDFAFGIQTSYESIFTNMYQTTSMERSFEALARYVMKTGHNSVNNFIESFNIKVLPTYASLSNVFRQPIETENQREYGT